MSQSPPPAVSGQPGAPGRRGRLLLVPTPLDHGCADQVALAQVMPLGTLQAAAGLTHWICENNKSARAFLKRLAEVCPLPCSLQDMQMTELPHAVHKQGDHTGRFDSRGLLQAALQGHDLGLLSEAGMPAVADPGASVVRAAHDLGLQVMPLVGPVSLLLALAASGLNGQSFAFVGYLPQDPGARQHRLRELEALALRQGQTQMFIETPYRNPALWQALLQTLAPQTRLVLASGLTLPCARVCSDTVKNWRRLDAPLDKSTPAVFALGR